MADVLYELLRLAIVVLFLKIRIDTSMQVFGFTYIDNLLVLVVVAIHPGLVGNTGENGLDIFSDFQGSLSQELVN